MSIEDDIARVNAVTDKLTGPRKVWVFIVETDNGIVGVHALNMKSSAKDLLDKDLKDHAQTPMAIAQAQIDLELKHGCYAGAAHYSLHHLEIK